MGIGWKFLAISFSFATASLQVFAQECSRPSGSFRLSATGDILIHQALFQAVIHQPDKFKSLWSRVETTLKDADLTVGNLEGPVAPGTGAGGVDAKDPGFVYDGKVYSGTNFLFNYHPFLVSDLKSSGFSLVTTANNHAMDRGSIGIDRTIEQLKKAGLNFAGTRPAGSSESLGRIVSVKSFKIGVVACAEMLNGFSDKREQVLSCGSQAVVDLIRNLSQQADGVVVFPHWGEEYQNNPEAGQRALARRWVAAGATAIIGNHPHVLQTTEWIARPDGEKALVIYSLGNFVAGQGAMEKRATAIVHLDFKMFKSRLRVEQFSYTPIIRPGSSIALDYIRAKDSSEYRHVQSQLGPVTCR